MAKKKKSKKRKPWQHAHRVLLPDDVEQYRDEVQNLIKKWADLYVSQDLDAIGSNVCLCGHYANYDELNAAKAAACKSCPVGLYLYRPGCTTLEAWSRIKKYIDSEMSCTYEQWQYDVIKLLRVLRRMYNCLNVKSRLVDHYEPQPAHEIACLRCGKYGKVSVEATTVIDVHPSGHAEAVASFEWHDNAETVCGLCNFTAPMHAFDIVPISQIQAPSSKSPCYDSNNIV